MAINLSTFLLPNAKPLLERNLHTLWNRKKGELLYVRENGELAKYEGVAKFFYQLNPSESDRRITQAVTEIFKNIDPEKINHEFAQQLFSRFGLLSKRVFDRNAAISERLEASLSSHFQEEEKARALEKEEQSFKRDVCRVKLAACLGMGLKLISGGSSGVYLGTTIRGEKICVFKPRDEGPYGENNPKLKTRIKRYIKRCLEMVGFNFQRVSLYKDGEYLSEVFASVVDRFLRPRQKQKQLLVPFTYIETFNSSAFKGETVKIGSCQKWVDGGREASQDAPSIDLQWDLFYYKSKTVNVPNEEFDDFAIRDFLFGNQDRDTDNWKYIEEGGEKRIVLFDHGLAFNHQHPKGTFSTRKQYLWTRLTNADRPFTKYGKEQIEWIYAQRHEMVKELQKYAFTKEQAQVMKERIEVLYHLKESKVCSISQYRTDEEFDQFFASHGEIKRSSLGEIPVP